MSRSRPMPGIVAFAASLAAALFVLAIGSHLPPTVAWIYALHARFRGNYP